MRPENEESSMTDTTPGAATDGGPGQGLTDAEKLAALGTYIKVLTDMEKDLRAAVTSDMGKRHVEKVGAYLPDGTKMASVSHTPGRKSARVTDDAAALAWCLRNHPEEVQTVQMIRPAYLKMLLDLAKADDAAAGSLGMDPLTGEELPFIEVTQGSPFVTITTTTDGRNRMAALAGGFAGMLEGPQATRYDPDFADRLENGGYR
jgi:hypothetical protein